MSEVVGKYGRKTREGRRKLIDFTTELGGGAQNNGITDG